MTLSPLLLVTLALITAQGLETSTSHPSALETEAGPIRGVVEGDLLSFKGIPFAAPPVGELRWRPPQPPEPWTETLVADSYGHACPQVVRDSTPEWAKAHLADVGLDEDCLTLNVWRPLHAVQDPLPVMVYFHALPWM